MSSFTELELKVLRWAEDRGILKNGTSGTQMLKTVSELGETCDALIKRDHEALRDGIGDVLVTLIIVSELEGLHLMECLEAAWNEIKDRRGYLNSNGVFVKEEK
jgi:hypothetical protein